LITILVSIGRDRQTVRQKHR